MIAYCEACSNSGYYQFAYSIYQGNRRIKEFVSKKLKGRNSIGEAAAVFTAYASHLHLDAIYSDCSSDLKDCLSKEDNTEPRRLAKLFNLSKVDLIEIVTLLENPNKSVYHTARHDRLHCLLYDKRFNTNDIFFEPNATDIHKLKVKYRYEKDMIKCRLQGLIGALKDQKITKDNLSRLNESIHRIIEGIQ